MKINWIEGAQYVNRKYAREANPATSEIYYVGPAGEAGVLVPF